VSAEKPGEAGYVVLCLSTISVLLSIPECAERLAGLEDHKGQNVFVGIACQHRPETSKARLALACFARLCHDFKARDPKGDTKLTVWLGSNEAAINMLRESLQAACQVIPLIGWCQSASDKQHAVRLLGNGFRKTFAS